MKNIYIVLIKAHTGLGKLAKTITKYDYTHIAVCFDNKLTEFITYSRRRHYLPLDAGFMYEYRDYYAFGKNNKVRVKVFRLPVNDDCYINVKEFIKKCKNDNMQMFNLFSMLTMPVIHGFRIYKSHNCMSFVARITELSGAVKMNKPYYRYSIKELDRLLNGYEYFEGNLKRISSKDYEKYMKKPLLSEYFHVSAYTIFTLIKRMLFCNGIEE